MWDRGLEWVDARDETGRIRTSHGVTTMRSDGGTATLERVVVKRNDVSVKIDAEVARLAKIVAAFEDKTLAQYLSDILKPIVEGDVERHTRDYGKGGRTPPIKPKGSWKN